MFRSNSIKYNNVILQHIFIYLYIYLFNYLYIFIYYLYIYFIYLSIWDIRTFCLWCTWYFIFAIILFLLVLLGDVRSRDDHRGGSKGLTKDGINDTASALFAEVKAIHSKAKKPKPGGAGYVNHIFSYDSKA